MLLLNLDAVKLIWTLFLIFLSALAYGQNYQPINSRSVQAFFQTTPIPQSWGAEGNMWGTRIDSTQLASNGDSIYHNYPIYRDTAIENGNWGGSPDWINAPNWNGFNTRLEPSGISWFYNHSGDSLRIDYSRSLYAEWTAFNYDNGDSLIAKVVNVQWVDDGWISDSVKTIGFTRYSGGTIVADNINNVELELYKVAGFRKMIDFAMFPFDTVQIYQVDLNCINLNSPGYSANGSVYPMPTIGDGYYSMSTCTTYNMGYTCGNSASSESVLDVSIDSLTGQISATIQRNWQNGPTTQSSTSMVVYEPLPDTLVTLATFLSVYSGTNPMPREELEWLFGGTTYRYSNTETIGGQNGCNYPIVTIFQPPSECLYGEYRFSPYVGLVESNWNEDNYYCTGWVDHHVYYDYLRVGDLICGTQLVVGLNEQDSKPSAFTFYPNPASSLLNLQLSDASVPTKLTLSVADVLGRVIFNLELSTSYLELNVSAWPNGIYFVSVSDQSEFHNTQRLVVQH